MRIALWCQTSAALAFAASLAALGIPTETGEFGADMAVELVNDGPVTIWLDL